MEVELVSNCRHESSFMLPELDRSKIASKLVTSSYRYLNSMANGISAPRVVQ